MKRSKIQRFKPETTTHEFVSMLREAQKKSGKARLERIESVDGKARRHIDASTPAVHHMRTEIWKSAKELAPETARSSFIQKHISDLFTEKINEIRLETEQKLRIAKESRVKVKAEFSRLYRNALNEAEREAKAAWKRLSKEEKDRYANQEQRKLYVVELAEEQGLFDGKDRIKYIQFARLMAKDEAGRRSEYADVAEDALKIALEKNFDNVMDVAEVLKRDPQHAMEVFRIAKKERKNPYRVMEEQRSMRRVEGGMRKTGGR